jgi:hypothetical protein
MYRHAKNGNRLLEEVSTILRTQRSSPPSPPVEKRDGIRWNLPL